MFMRLVMFVARAGNQLIIGFRWSGIKLFFYILSCVKIKFCCFPIQSRKLVADIVLFFIMVLVIFTIRQIRLNSWTLCSYNIDICWLKLLYLCLIDKMFAIRNSRILKSKNFRNVHKIGRNFIQIIPISVNS